MEKTKSFFPFMTEQEVAKEIGNPNICEHCGGRLKAQVYYWKTEDGEEYEDVGEGGHLDTCKLLDY